VHLSPNLLSSQAESRPADEDVRGSGVIDKMRRVR
jgi:hypothetical protein